MPLNKSYGNMYDWVTHTWSPIVGCSHQCSYCYVRKNHELPIIPILKEDFPKLGSKRVIFVGHLCDMFSENTLGEHINKVLHHCEQFPDNTYVIQTKNVARLLAYVPLLPRKLIIGTTIETNREDIIREISSAPLPKERVDAFKKINAQEKFITIEPILDFDIEEFSSMIVECNPSFVNIGADSKGHGLKEPSTEKLNQFIRILMEKKIVIRKKINLERLGIDISEFVK